MPLHGESSPQLVCLEDACLHDRKCHEDLAMLECSLCTGIYHFDCVGRETTRQATQDKFVCPTCKHYTDSTSSIEKIEKMMVEIQKQLLKKIAALEKEKKSDKEATIDSLIDENYEL